MIRRNSAKCEECNTEIVSRHRHDYVVCSCGAVAVDGGRDYLKRSVKPTAKWVDTSIIDEEPEDVK